MKITQHIDDYGDVYLRTQAGNIITLASLNRLEEISKNLDKSRRDAEEFLEKVQRLLEQHISKSK